MLVGGLLTAPACGLSKAPDPTPTPPPFSSNAFDNPGLEDGDRGWTYREADAQWSPFSIGDSARTGHGALSLELRGAAADTRTHIAGAVQKINPQFFPEYVSGYYRVDDWRPAATFQYLQFVVAVYGGGFDDEFNIHEVRFPIAGVDRIPLVLSNARWIFLSRDPPVLHRWTYFGYPVADAFKSRWGKIPPQWDSIDVFFEVRYDEKTEEQGATSADVRYDDLYAGPQVGNPNTP